MTVCSTVGLSHFIVHGVVISMAIGGCAVAWSGDRAEAGPKARLIARSFPVAAVLIDAVAIAWTVGGLDEILYASRPLSQVVASCGGNSRGLGPGLGMLAWFATCLAIGSAWLLLARRMGLRITSPHRLAVSFGLVWLVAYAPFIAMGIVDLFRPGLDHMQMGIKTVF
jgi:hypothetical protein